MAFRHQRIEEEGSEYYAAWTRRALEIAGSGRWNLECNQSLVLNATLRKNPDPSAGEFAQMAEVLGQEGRLALSENYSRPLRDFFDQYPQFVNNQANVETLERLCIEENLPWELDSLIFVSGQPDSGLAVTQAHINNQQAQQRAEQQAARDAQDLIDLRAEIMGWEETLQQNLLSKRRVDNYQYQHALRTKKKEVDSMPLEQLRTLVENRREVRRASTMDPKAFRAEVSAKINQPTREEQRVAPQSAYSEFETMPLEWTPRGSLTPITLDRKMLIFIANNDRELFKTLMRRFGSESLNARLSGRG